MKLRHPMTPRHSVAAQRPRSSTKSPAYSAESPRTLKDQEIFCVSLSLSPQELFGASRVFLSLSHGEVGGWGRDPKKCTGRDWGMGSSTI